MKVPDSIPSLFQRPIPFTASDAGVSIRRVATSSRRVLEPQELHSAPQEPRRPRGGRWMPTADSL